MVWKFLIYLIYEAVCDELILSGKEAVRYFSWQVIVTKKGYWSGVNKGEVFWIDLWEPRYSRGLSESFRWVLLVMHETRKSNPSVHFRERKRSFLFVFPTGQWFTRFLLFSPPTHQIVAFVDDGSWTFMGLWNYHRTRLILYLGLIWPRTHSMFFYPYVGNIAHRHSRSMTQKSH